MAGALSGQWSLVTGASSGLGEEFARQLAVRGSSLVLSARSEDKLENLARELTQAHAIEVKVIPMDLAASGGAETLVRRVRDDIEALKLVINNAGFGDAMPFARSNPEQQAQMVRLNCETLVTLTRAFLPGMLQREDGGFIQVASVVSLLPVPYMATYAASKAFVLSFSEAVAEELRDSNVRMMALCPGPVPTGFQAAAGMELTGLERWAALPPGRVVRVALRDYERGRRVSFPGGVNSLQRALIGCVPRPLAARLSGLTVRLLGRA